MAIQTGISGSQARKLMELAKSAGRRPKVRTVEKNSSKQHSGRAFLLEVLNDHQAKIQPFNHGGKVETVDLASLRLWTGGNEFNIEEARKVNHAAPAIAIQATGEEEPKDKFFIFSKKMQMVWGGERHKWTQNFHLAVHWSSSEAEISERVLRRLKSLEASNDAVLLSEGVAYDALLEEMTKPAVVQQAVPIVEVKPIFTRTVPMSTLAAPAPSAPPISDEFIDLDAVFNPQESALRMAETSRKEAVLEYQKAKKFCDDMKAKCALLDANVVKLGGHSVLKGAAPQGSKGKKKRVFLRSKIQKILLASSRLDSETVHQRLLVEVPGNVPLKTQQALSAMKADELAERDDNGGWALTKKGREAEMMDG